MNAKVKINHLNQAKEHVNSVLDELDLSDESCDSCGSRHYNNFNDQQLGKKLSGIVQKLENEIGKLRGGAKKGRGDYHAKETRHG